MTLTPSQKRVLPERLLRTLAHLYIACWMRPWYWWWNKQLDEGLYGWPKMQRLTCPQWLIPDVFKILAESEKQEL